MLMQNFKSSADLGITEPQKEALMKTLVLLETGALSYIPIDDLKPVTNKKLIKIYTGGFNMAYWHSAHSCGTAGCIGGTAEKVGGVSFEEVPDNLHALFYPSVVGRFYNIRPNEAATALRSYLTTGDPKWAEAVA